MAPAVPDNPYAPPGENHSSGAPSVRNLLRPNGAIVSVLAVLFLLVVVGGLLGLLIETESVMVTGSLLTSLGCLLALLARNRRLIALRILGWSGPLVSISCFLVIYERQWSPAEAHVPLLITGALYTLLCGSLIASWAAQVRVLRTDTVPHSHRQGHADETLDSGRDEL